MSKFRKASSHHSGCSSESLRSARSAIGLVDRFARVLSGLAERPLAVFAGVCTTWHGVRGSKAKPVEGDQQLFGVPDVRADL